MNSNNNKIIDCFVLQSNSFNPFKNKMKKSQSLAKVLQEQHSLKKTLLTKFYNDEKFAFAWIFFGIDFRISFWGIMNFNEF